MTTSNAIGTRRILPPRRDPTAGRRGRHPTPSIVVLLLAALMGGCGGDDVTNVVEDLYGKRFPLVSSNGMSLPAIYYQSESYDVAIYSGAIKMGPLINTFMYQACTETIYAGRNPEGPHCSESRYHFDTAGDVLFVHRDPDMPLDRLQVRGDTLIWNYRIFSAIPDVAVFRFQRGE